MNYFSNLFHYILFLLKASMYFLSPRLYFRCIRYHHSFYFLSLQLYRDKILPIQFSIWQIRIRAHTQVRTYSRHIINYNESNNYQNWKFYVVNNFVNKEDKYNIDVHNWKLLWSQRKKLQNMTEKLYEYRNPICLHHLQCYSLYIIKYQTFLVNSLNIQ